jgi:monoamine oxidase
MLARQNGGATWWCWTGKGADGRARKVVTSFAGTRSAVEAVSDDWPAGVAEAAPEVDLGPEAVFMDWGREEWFGGCYSALGPGDEALLGAFETEARLVFAGEHTIGSGTIDGAITSGEAAAGRLIRFLARSGPV